MVAGGRAGRCSLDRWQRRVDVEDELRLGEPRIDAAVWPRARRAVRPALDERQPVGAGRAGMVQLDDQPVLELAVGSSRAVNLDRPYARPPRGAVDPDVAGVQPTGRVFEEVDEEPSAALANLDAVDPVAAALADLARRATPATTRSPQRISRSCATRDRRRQVGRRAGREHDVAR